MTGEFLTRATVWIAIVVYTVGSVIFVFRGSRRDAVVRVLWSIACASLIAHFISAFQFYHGWSHRAAYLDTARQTEQVLGQNWGGGLFINYLVLIVWIVDISSWWLRGLNSYRRRPWHLVMAWHFFLIFIIFNATVVFGHGAIRWVGGVACLMSALACVRTGHSFASTAWSR